MEIGIVGLGRMGGNMAERLTLAGHRVVGCDPSQAARDRMTRIGATGVSTYAELIGALEQSPRVVWVMVPAGQITENALTEITSLLSEGDIVIDGGNSKYTDTIRHHDTIQALGKRFLDVGTSGGIWGLKEGYCLMVGGEKETYEVVEPLLSALAQEGGLLYVGAAGAGHYVKMVHNGIEYALMQSYAEGFEIMRGSPYPDLDLSAICDLWMHGSVVRSWLLELAGNAFQADPYLDLIDDYVEDSGEGRWTVESTIEYGVPAPIIALSLYLRFRSRQQESFSAKVLAALRKEFGGHATHPKKDE